MKEIKIMNSSKKVILTGASGLIGKEAIVPLQKSGFDIYAFTIDKNNPDNGVNWIDCNIFDGEKVRKAFEAIKPEYFLHFAWATTNDYLTSAINFDFINASLSMLKNFAANGGVRAVFAGTCFEYEFKETPLKESDPKKPLTVYAACKNALNNIASLYAEHNGVSFGWGRIFYVYGYGEHKKRLTASIINSFKANKKVIINYAELLRDYMYAKDIAEAFVKFLESDVKGDVNICSAKAVSLGEYASFIAKKLNKANLLILDNIPSGNPSFIVGNNSRLLNEVKYAFSYSLEQGLDEVLKNA
jgi:nucleoside-diphosphate-sugar epimerase